MLQNHFKHFLQTTLLMSFVNVGVLMGKAYAQESEPSLAQEITEARADMRESYDEFSLWCRDTTFFLDSGQQQARRAYRLGHFTDAARIFKHSIDRTLSPRIPRYFRDAYSTRLLIRAQGIANYAVTLRNERRLRTVVSFLDNYIDYIRTVIDRLDTNYFRMPSCGSCRDGGYSIDQSEELFSDITFEGLSQVTQGFFVSRENLVTTVGDANEVFKLTEEMLEGALNDLGRLMYAQYYACMIQDLRNAHSELARYNRAGRLPFGVYTFAQLPSYFYDRINQALNPSDRRLSCRNMRRCQVNNSCN